jgi:hypothetical protein
VAAFAGWMSKILLFISVAIRPNASHDLLNLVVSHTTMHHCRQDCFGRVISSSQRPLPYNTQHSQQINIHASPVGLKPTISAGERPQTYALDRAATGIGGWVKYSAKFYKLWRSNSLYDNVKLPSLCHIFIIFYVQIYDICNMVSFMWRNWTSCSL